MTSATVPRLIAALIAGAVAPIVPAAVGNADTPDGCRAWGVGSWSAANCDATVGGEYRAEARCTSNYGGNKSPFGYQLPLSTREYGEWHAAGSGQDSVARCGSYYSVSHRLVEVRP